MRLARRAPALILSASVAATSGCGTLYYGTSEKIPVISEPPGAKVLVDGEPAGQTPVTIKLSRKHNHKIEIQKAGYITYQTTTETTSNDLAPIADVVPAMVFPPAILFLVGDYGTGAAYKIQPDKIDAHLLTAANTSAAAAAPPAASTSPAGASTPAAALSPSAAATPSASATPTATPTPTASPSPTPNSPARG
jgi:hypothetical protein